jgi:hypothetical protein
MRDHISPINFVALVFAVGLSLLCATSGWSQSRAANDIHRIDFRNFTYRPYYMNTDQPPWYEVTVTNGEYKKKYSDRDEEIFTVLDIVYGDLNGDGRDEAVVLTGGSGGGSMYVAEAYVYAMQNGKPVRLDVVTGSDRATGSVRAVRVVGGLLKAERLGNRMDQAIGAEYIDTTTYQLKGNKLLPVGRPVRRSLRGEAVAKRLQVERGKTSAVITGSTSAAKFYVLRVRGKQTLTVQITSTLGNARFELIQDDYTMAYRKTRWSGKIEYPADIYLVVVSNNGDADYRLEVTIR